MSRFQAHVSGAASHCRPSRRREILVVDDDALVVNSLDAQLGKVGRVTGVGSFERALAAWPTRRWDLVVVDEHLQDGSGTELIRHIRGGDPLVHVVLMSGDFAPRLSRGALDLRAYFVGKPIHPEWVDYLEAWLDERELLRQRLFRIGLTVREVEVFVWLASGASADETASACRVAVATVRSHTSHVYRRLGVGSLQQVVALAFGWAQP